MSKSRSSEPAPEAAPLEDPTLGIQQDLFGQMMQRQSQNRQEQINARILRQQQLGMPQGMQFGGFNPWVGLLQQLGGK